MRDAKQLADKVTDMRRKVKQQRGLLLHRQRLRRSTACLQARSQRRIRRAKKIKKRGIQLAQRLCIVELLKSQPETQR